MKTFLIIATGFCCIIVLLILFGNDKKLCGEYKLVWTSGGEVSIYRPSGGDTMVNGNIAAYAVHSPYIAGCVTAANLGTNLNIGAQGRFFILDTTTDKRLEGLSESQWTIELKTIGWENPKLKNLR